MNEITEESLGFRSSADRLSEERSSRREIMSTRLSFGIKFLDDVFRGIIKHDLVLVGAITGSGKTEMVTRIAACNALAGKRVYMFALEAEPAEIERRILFQELTRLYYMSGARQPLNYLGWIEGRYDELLSPFENLANEKIASLKNLKTFYRGAGFTIQDFESLFNVIQGKADLVVCDHIHYFDLASENENHELSKVIKKIRDLVQTYGIPVVLVGHLRKIDKRAKVLVPDIEDFHGTSNLAKICTKAIVMAPGGPWDGDPNLFQTYLRIAKFRLFGATVGYVGKALFDIKTNLYRTQYGIGRLSGDETQYNDLLPSEIPSWLNEVR